MTDHCPEKLKPGGCQLHNLHCGYPKCNLPPRIVFETTPTDADAEMRPWHYVNAQGEAEYTPRDLRHDAITDLALVAIQHGKSDEWVRQRVDLLTQDAVPAKPNLTDCEQMYDEEGVTLESAKPFAFVCCDCGLTHTCVIASEDGKPVGFAVRRDDEATLERRDRARTLASASDAAQTDSPESGALDKFGEWKDKP